ncbi:Origin recognition complex subunit 2 [Ascochyta rabiei]|uniref:Origin recognition complex subunit 2 n=1 Tax=Didymella rabiei TaxID=5454 RepID=A0A163KMM0_DIDRA|nr:Origin recognition complex subunit 2 [Ascochyta rabiei]KZM27109.1 DNA replication [Ascochyta rabiei]UPX12332.1 Origin recognition complex subunit 2 [Ascochyta rabiei]
MVSVKRRRDDAEDEGTPRKLRARIADEDATTTDSDTFEAQTPSRRARNQHLADLGTPKSILKKTGTGNGANAASADHGATPKSSRKLLFATPTKSVNGDAPAGTPTIVRNADRSARRKSNRQILERTLNGGEGDEEVLNEENSLAEQILEEEDAVVTAEEQTQEEVPVPETPLKRGRGRPKGSGKKKPKSPTPPTELPSHEEYFWQNRPGGLKTSNNTLSAQSLLSHDEYFQAMSSYRNSHRSEMELLVELHSRAFDQWMFELDEGFNVCLYGYGSKRSITDSFVTHLYRHLSEMTPYDGSIKTPKIAVINGYAAGTTLKEILTTIASIAVPTTIKLPNQPAVLLDFVLEHLSTFPPPHPVPVVLNSIDSPYLRKSPVPSMLARLAAHSSINLLCTADTPSFPLLWDVGLKTQYKFLFHDATTFAPYDAEIDVVETVNELLGRSGRRVGGRDGVGFVLRSLPENARSLYRILVMEQLTVDMMEQGLDDEDEATATPRNKKVTQAKAVVPESNQGVEYRVLYHKAVQEFVCSSEVGFRTLLKEFHDHQMIESRKDAMGTERLWVPFRQDELEGLAEDLASDAF